MVGIACVRWHLEYRDGSVYGIAQKNEDKEKARKMLKNYIVGLVVIAVILVACPYLVNGIAALIAG